MRTDEQLVMALSSVQAAPNGFGPEHESLCHDAARRLTMFRRAVAEKETALETSRRMLREISFAHLVLKEIDRPLVDAAVAKAAAKSPELAPYAPKLDGRPGPGK